jgi:hypothetical protein
MRLIYNVEHINIKRRSESVYRARVSMQMHSRTEKKTCR